MQERLQKLLAQAGYGSRRACEEFIIEGRVFVNGKKAELGQKADLAVDKVTMDGKALAKKEALIYIALYKPRNVLSASAAQDDRKIVRELIPLTGHLFPVGRLDYDSEGLILMTNDGDLTNKLTHPRYGHEKEYRVLLSRRPDEEQLSTWRRGVILEDGDKTQPADVKFLSTSGKGAWIRIVMGEGKKRQIREVGKLLGLPVVRIIRLRIGTLRLDDLKPKQWRHLTEDEVAELQGDKGKIEARVQKPRAKRRHPTDLPKRVPKEKSKLAPNERPRTKDKNERSRSDRSDRSRSNTKSRTPKR